MIGYKGMTKDMTCRGMKFEIGKTYHVDEEISLFKNGLTFCKNLIDVMDFYDINDSNRYFEVEANGIIKTDGKKSVASSLTILREISNIELYRMIYGTDNSSGYDHGGGCGNYHGNGRGNGDGYDNGDGCGCGYDNGNNNGGGYGDGINGYGSGCGYGDGDGFGNIQRIIKYI